MAAVFCCWFLMEMGRRSHWYFGIISFVLMIDVVRFRSCFFSNSDARFVACWTFSVHFPIMLCCAMGAPSGCAGVCEMSGCVFFSLMAFALNILIVQCSVSIGAGKSRITRYG